VADAAAVFAAVTESMAELTPWMPWCHPGYSIHESYSWLQLQTAAFDRGDAYEFAITTADGAYLGGCGLNQIDRANNRANLGYWVRTSAARRGVATSAVVALRDWGFARTSLIRLEIVIAVENAASRRVAEKSGALLEGVLRDRLVLEGSAHDAAMFSITRRDVTGEI
jgi:RimJ/RimL family protein N-acetyltransferase